MRRATMPLPGSRSGQRSWWPIRHSATRVNSGLACLRGATIGREAAVPEAKLSGVVDLVSNALRRKLLNQGAQSLSDAEWHLLRVSHLLNAIEGATLDRLLADSPAPEILALAAGLDAVDAPDAARSVREAVTELTAANNPGLGLERSEIVAAAARALAERLGLMRTGIEQQLLIYAFRQRELESGEPLPP
jgi:hypothetical protein